MDGIFFKVFNKLVTNFNYPDIKIKHIRWEKFIRSIVWLILAVMVRNVLANNFFIFVDQVSRDVLGMLFRVYRSPRSFSIKWSRCIHVTCNTFFGVNNSESGVLEKVWPEVKPCKFRKFISRRDKASSHDHRMFSIKARYRKIFIDLIYLETI